jgi:hypothetical protein
VAVAVAQPLILLDDQAVQVAVVLALMIHQAMVALAILHQHRQAKEIMVEMA